MDENAPDTGGARRRPFAEPIDAWFSGFIVLEVLSGALAPYIPLLLAALAIATPLRRSCWRLITVITLGVVLGLLFCAPYLLDLLDLQIIEQGPARPAG